MDKTKKYFEYYTNKAIFQRIDDFICDDLHVDEVFKHLNYTLTPVGEQYLYNLLRNIPVESEIKKREEWLQIYNEDSNLKNYVVKTLSKLQSQDAYAICSLFETKHIAFSKWKFFLFKVLQFLPFICLLIFFLFQINIFILLTSCIFIINLFIHYKNKSLSFVYSHSLPQLFKLIRVAETLSKNQIFEKFKINATLNQLKMLKKQLSFFRFELKIESDINIIAWFISEVFRIFFLLEPLIFHKIFILIQRHKTELEKIYEFVGLIDSLQSVSTLRNKQIDCCIPQYMEKGNAVLTNDVYHPLIKDCIKNTFSTENHSFLILVSNMSGKTTFIRTIAINVLLAQTVNTCFAKSFSLKKQKIWTSISLKDNLANQESYYLSEVLKIKDIIDNTASENHLIVIDELFKGTNTQERTAAAKAVLTYLSHNNGNTILVTSHDIELCNLLDNKKFITTHFSEKIENSDLSFPYTLNLGKPTSRNAIKILELYNYPEEITKDAKNFSFTACFMQ